MRTEKIKRALIVLYLGAIHILIAFLLYERFFRSETSLRDGSAEQEVNSVVALPTPVAIPFEANNLPAPPVNAEQIQRDVNAQTNSNTELNTQPNSNISTGGAVAESSERLMIPVVGIRRENLTDTFADARSAGRVHNAIDIMAAGGTPVVAATDGEIARFHDSELGGITIYQYGRDKKTIYYYAHLQRRAENLQIGAAVKQGMLLGYVGDTGNAGAGNYHLHFSIIVPQDPKRFWEGTNLNPYPLLTNGIEAPQ